MIHDTPMDRSPPGRFETLVAGLILFVNTGAIIPQLYLPEDGVLPEAAREAMRQQSIPVFVAILLLAIPHWRAVVARMAASPALLGLLLLAGLSSLWSIAPDITPRRTAALAFSTLFAAYLVVRFSPDAFVRLLAWVLTVALLLSVAFVALPGRGIDPLDQSVRGVFTHKNLLGRYSMLTILALLLVTPRSGAERAMRGMAGALAVFLLLASFSVTPLLILTVTLGMRVLVAIFRRPPLEMLVLFFFFMAAATLAAAMAVVFSPVILELVGRDATMTGRTELWDLAWTRIQLHPWLGYGYQAFWALPDGPALLILKIVDWGPPNAHSGYLDLALSLGAVGAGLFAVALLSGLVRSVRDLRRDPSAGSAFPFLYLIMFALLNVTESLILDQTELSWILFMTAVLRRPADAMHREAPAPAPKAGWPGTLLSDPPFAGEVTRGPAR